MFFIGLFHLFFCSLGLCLFVSSTIPMVIVFGWQPLMCLVTLAYGRLHATLTWVAALSDNMGSTFYNLQVVSFNQVCFHSPTLAYWIACILHIATNASFSFVTITMLTCDVTPCNIRTNSSLWSLPIAIALLWPLNLSPSVFNWYH